MSKRPLLILDIDETLVSGKEVPMVRDYDFMACDYFVYLRPHVREFLRTVGEFYELACWSSASQDYLAIVVNKLFLGIPKPVFVWDRSHCTLFFDFFEQENYFLKDLTNVKNEGFDLERVLILDDDPRKLQGYTGNAIFIEPFNGSPLDEELLKVMRYLLAIHTTADFRKLEKGKWRNQVF